MPRDALVYLQDILEAIARIREYTRGLDRQTFGADTRTVESDVRKLLQP
jgi:uncharacterized protein with HEPN domain